VKVLLVTDLHLTDPALRPQDEYRWKVFDWIREVIHEHGIGEVFVLGDITDRKDNHSALLTNMVVEEFCWLSAEVPVRILTGNHDYLVAGQPFFGFLRNMPRIKWYDDIAQLEIGGRTCLFIPHRHGDTSEHIRGAIEVCPDSEVVFMHHTVSGSILSNGRSIGTTKLSAELADVPIYSGDVHMPQQVGDVTYVGTPYPVHFGDDYTGRALILDFDRDLSQYEKVRMDTIRKFTASILSPLDLHAYHLQEGDQVKVRLEVPRHLVGEWDEMRQECHEICRDYGAELASVEMDPVAAEEGQTRELEAARVDLSADEAFDSFVESEDLEERIVTAGRSLME
jgi:DNA repair exonuclease SbcCD nuclease subunit